MPEKSMASAGPDHLSDCQVFPSVEIHPETVLPFGLSADEMEERIEALGAKAFGPGRFARAAFRLREGRKPIREISFTAWHKGELIGSVRQTGIAIGEKAALVLGPLVVTPEYKNAGVGGALMTRAVAASWEHGHEMIILVGDFPYYRRFGFRQVPHGQIGLPGPADPVRILYCEAQKGLIADYRGTARRGAL